MIDKTLQLTLRLNENGWFDVDVYEPESGSSLQLNHPYCPNEHPEFNEDIGDEIYSWLGIMVDDLEAELTDVLEAELTDAINAREILEDYQSLLDERYLEITNFLEAIK